MAASLVLTMPVNVSGVRGLGLVDAEVSDLKLGWSKGKGWGKSAILVDMAAAPLRLFSKDCTSRCLLQPAKC